MDNLQSAKALVQDHYAALESADSETIMDALAQRVAPNCHWRGFHPWNEQHGVEAIADAFWRPFLAAVSSVQRREDIFFAGKNQIDGFKGVWTVSMGHLMGLFDADWLGIPPTRKLVMLRYAEFNRVENGQIVETAFYCDVLHFMRQAGITRFPGETGAFLVQPGPRTHDGRLLDRQDADEGNKTLTLINRMIGEIDAANENPKARTPHEELAETWHEDFVWWGPEGIGATYTIPRYIEQHQKPFRTLLGHRIFNGHVARLAEGAYGGFFGWPNLSLLNIGGYMGVAPTGDYADMRVIDLYRRDGDKLAENWVFIDILHFLKMQGVDILAELDTD